jgi:hypothetical protein
MQYSIPLSFKYSPQHPVLRHPQSVFPLGSETKFHTRKEQIFPYHFQCTPVLPRVSGLQCMYFASIGRPKSLVTRVQSRQLFCDTCTYL